MTNKRLYQATSRRSVIQSLGAITTAGIGTAGTAAATDSNGAGASEIGIAERVETLLERGQFQQADRLLDRNGVESYSATETVAGNSGSDSPDDISTQAQFDDDESTLHIQVFNDHDAVYRASAIIRLEGSESTWQYASKANDGCGLTWDLNNWSATDPDRSNVELDAYFADRSGGPSIALQEYDPNLGVGAEVSWTTEAAIGVPTNVKMATYLEDETDDGDPTPVQFRYDHIGTLSSTLASVSVSVGVAGLSVDFSNAKELWWEHVTAGPGEHDSR